MDKTPTQLEKNGKNNNNLFFRIIGETESSSFLKRFPKN